MAWLQQTNISPLVQPGVFAGDPGAHHPAV